MNDRTSEKVAASLPTSEEASRELAHDELAQRQKEDDERIPEAALKKVTASARRSQDPRP